MSTVLKDPAQGRRLVYGIGINDADYTVEVKVTISGKGERRRQTVGWACPFFQRWKHMMQRCYSEAYQRQYPSYVGCSVAVEWHSFMAFRRWMVTQDWLDKELDKDLLAGPSKIYSPTTCLFITSRLNSFLTENTAARGEWPIGVDLDKRSGRFRARCRCVVTGKLTHLGCYRAADDAHTAWLDFKLHQARYLASKESDPRIARALIERYENYGKVA